MRLVNLQAAECECSRGVRFQGRSLRIEAKFVPRLHATQKDNLSLQMLYNILRRIRTLRHTNHRRTNKKAAKKPAKSNHPRQSVTQQTFCP
jgi:hypothetical protein